MNKWVTIDLQLTKEPVQNPMPCISARWGGVGVGEYSAGNRGLPLELKSLASSVGLTTNPSLMSIVSTLWFQFA